jgi:hypothetical protein
VVYLATFFVCICVHESGHALAGYLTGGRITEIALVTLTPHVRIAGECTRFEECVRAAAGSAFFLIAFFAFALMRRGDVVREAASWFAVVELLGWVLSSVFSPSVMGPNDAARLLEVSGANHFTVAAAAVSVGFLGYASLRALTRPRVRQSEAPVAVTKTALVGN